MAKSSTKTYNYNNTVREFLARHNKQAGEVGIEIECEGQRLPGMDQIEEFWVTHADGSLRGESIEYVMNGPVPRESVIPALEYLDELFKKSKTKIKDSYRTSVHVHINMQDVSIKQTYNTVLMYGILEDILTEYAGATRVGNLFCLRMSDAEFMLQQLREGAVTDRYEHLNNNGLRYAGCNVKSLFDHNSLEFRAFRGTTDMKLIAEWVDIILQIKDAGLSYTNPTEMLQNFSNLGPEGFLAKNFNGHMCKLIKGYPKWQDRVFAGVRLVQDVAYANDWALTPEKKSASKAEPKMAYYDVEARPPELDNAGMLDRLLRMQREQAVAAPPVQRARVPRRPNVLGNPFEPLPEILPGDAWPAARDEEL